MSEFDPRHGELVPLGEGIARVTAPNEGPFTGAGTNTYLVGTDRLMIIDPGPDDADHVAAVTTAVAGREVTHILLTHTHRDHVGALQALRSAVGGEVIAEGPHRLSRPLFDGETNPFERAGDNGFRPDRSVADGDTVDNGETVLGVITTPGHAANHVVYERGADCFSGDHVMGWSTSVVAPPDGSMGAYMASLDKLIATSHVRFLPGHGGAIDEPAKVVSAIKTHRLLRERAILERIVEGDRTVADIVEALYGGIDPRLRGAAGLSVLAHLEKLAEEGRVDGDGFGREATWTPRQAA
ncbi:MBL fold metallo-hydrolase [Acuticoccus sp.]|uniref:MBL fold metallo-hydrolase n=1 Tax=Acuticoccus sp. TaxID=1904378 RepID=UPI003B51C37A